MEMNLWLTQIRSKYRIPSEHSTESNELFIISTFPQDVDFELQILTGRGKPILLQPTPRSAGG